MKPSDSVTSLSVPKELESWWIFASSWFLTDHSRLAVGLQQFCSAMNVRGGYHSLPHIERMMLKYRQWILAANQSPDPRLVGWIFAHDYVYVPGATDNEEQSVARMNDLLQKIGAQRLLSDDDHTAILSTKTHDRVRPEELHAPELADLIDLLQDLDLEILSASQSEYEIYRSAVYLEYFGATIEAAGFDKLWKVGRKAFLESMLSRIQIYKTPPFAMLEQPARDNMTEELRSLF